MVMSGGSSRGRSQRPCFCLEKQLRVSECICVFVRRKHPTGGMGGISGRGR